MDKINKKLLNNLANAIQHTGLTLALGVCILLSGVFPSKDAGANTIYSLWADQDAYIRSDLPVRENDNYGAEEFMTVGTGQSPIMGEADQMRSLVSFGSAFDWMTSVLSSQGMSNLDMFNNIRRARLDLVIAGYDSIGSTHHPESFIVEATGITDNWVEGGGSEASGAPPGNPGNVDTELGVDWLSQPGVGGPDPSAIIFESIDGVGTRISWDLTWYAKLWAHDSTVFTADKGIMLQDTTTSGTFQGVKFYTREGEAAGGSGYGPRLHIEVPEPMTGILLGIGLVGLMAVRRQNKRQI